MRINAAVRPYGLNYSQFMNGVKLTGLDLNRKMLSELAINQPQEFAKVVEVVKKTLSK